MKLKIKKIKLDWELFTLIILFGCFCEFLYTTTTGAKTSVVLIILCFWGITLFIQKKIKITKRDIICLCVVFVVIIYSNSSESIRYGLTLLTILIWEKFKFKAIPKFVTLLTSFGLILCLIQFLQGTTRVYGFFASSAPQMACTLIVCEAYLLVDMANNGVEKKKMTLVVGSLISIFLTGTRSALLMGFALFLVYFVIIYLIHSNISGKKTLSILILVIMVIAFLINSNQLFFLLENKIGRNDMQASSNTRIGLYTVLWHDFTENARSFLVGRGGGYVEQRLMGYLGKNFYFPGHQDYLLILCEYGTIGLIAVFSTFLKCHSAWLFFIIVFTLTSFHNAVLTPTTMLLLSLCMCDIESRRYSLWIKRKN